jgi:hypothetical protein
MIVLLLLLTGFKKFQIFIRRYFNTVTIKIFPFTIFDISVWSLIFLIIINYFFLPDNFKLFSPQLIVFLKLNIIVLLIWFIIAFIKSFQKKEKNSITQPEDFLNDNPITNSNEDLLGRNEFINHLNDELLSLKIYHEYSFTIGIHASWGEGKSSVINLLKEKLKDNSDFLIVDNFNPWQYMDEQAIINGFFSEIEKKINETYIFDTNHYFKKYAKLISLGVNYAGVKLDLKDSNETFSYTKSRIQKIINKLNKKIIVIIDDVDRLDISKILLIFKLISLNAKFNNLVFILCFDSVLVQRYLIDNKYDKDYLEKIIQKPIVLPVIERSNLRKYLFEGILNILQENGVIKINAQKEITEISYFFNIEFGRFFTTLRNVKMFLKNLKFDIPFVINEINIKDFLFLTVVKVFYPKVYSNIAKFPGYFINVQPNSPFSLENIFGYNDKEKTEKISAYINNLVSKEENSDALLFILKKLFPLIDYATSYSPYIYNNVVSDRINKRICEHDCFPKYFLLKVPTDQISDEYFDKVVIDWNKSEKKDRLELIKKEIDEFIKKNNLIEFLDRFFIYEEKLEIDSALTFIEVILKNCKNFSQERDWGSFSVFQRSCGLTMFLINKKLNADEIGKIIPKIVKDAPYLPFVFYTLYTCIKKGGDLNNVYSSVNSDELVEIAKSRMKLYYIDNGNDIIEEFKDDENFLYVIYQWAINWEFGTENNYDIVNPYIQSLLRNDIKNFSFFISKFYKLNTLSRVNKMDFDLNTMSKICNLNELLEMAESFDDFSELNEEERNVLKSFIDKLKNRSE